MAEHTPGPWRVGKNYGAVIADTAPEGHLPDADLEASEIKAYGGYVIGESIAKCNRSLIAAAPDLLEAAKYALSVIRSQGMYDLSERRAARRLQEAIARAYGVTEE
ncbi:MAG: hypothetical protein ABFD96_03350 [Armatimonadia bacterium]